MSEETTAPEEVEPKLAPPADEQTTQSSVKIKYTGSRAPITVQTIAGARQVKTGDVVEVTEYDAEIFLAQKGFEKG